jgi:hypothetical protein
VNLLDRAGSPAAALSHGDQRKLEVAILLALEPEVFMFDEPTAGMSVDEVPIILDLIETIKESGDKTILLVEHKMDVVRRLADRGHELACHGYAHARVYTQSREEFRADVERAADTIAEAGGRRPLAYRAPAFSINCRTPWAYDVLTELGFRYDSSQYDSPRIPDRIAPVPSEPFRLELGDGRSLWELPVPVWHRIPIGGGSYWRVLPAAVIRRGLDALGRQTAYAVLYFHPYEFDPEPLRATPPSPTPGRRLAAAGKSLWRNAGRPLVAQRLREIARDHHLLSYDEAYDDIARRYGTRTRALSPQGVLV